MTFQKRRLALVLVESVLLIGVVLSVTACADVQEESASQRLATVLDWIRSGPVRAEGETVQWTYGNGGRNARLDLEKLSSGDRISGPYWALDGTYYWVNGEEARSVSYQEIADDPTSRTALMAAELIATFTVSNPYAVLQSLDLGSLKYVEDEKMIEGRAQVRSVLLTALPSNAVESLMEGLETSTFVVRIEIGSEGQPLRTDIQWTRGESPPQLSTWTWAAAAAEPAPPESSTPLRSTVGS